MSLVRMVGQNHATRMALSWLRSGRVPHAILICGPEGTGKRAMAMELTSALLCTEPGADACDECAACRKVKSLSHPDLHCLVPLSGGRQNQEEEAVEADMRAVAREYISGSRTGASTAGNISREHLRQLRRRMAYAPAESSRRVAVILCAENMHPAGANSVLKILEEPPDQAVFVLVSAAPEHLLATIRSRCQRLMLRRLSSRDIAAQLAAEGFAADRAQLGVRMAEGSLERARQAGLGSLDETRARVERFMQAATEQDDAAYFKLVADLGARENRSELELFLKLCSLYLRDLFLLEHRCEELTSFPDKDHFLQQLRPVLSLSQVEAATTEVDRAVDYLARNINPGLVLADLWQCLRASDRRGGAGSRYRGQSPSDARPAGSVA